MNKKYTKKEIKLLLLIKDKDCGAVACVDCPIHNKCRHHFDIPGNNLIQTSKSKAKLVLESVILNQEVRKH